MDVKNLSDVPAFYTKDGSEIPELVAHRNSAIPPDKNTSCGIREQVLRLLCCCAPAYE